MTRTVALLAALDTKAEEALFLRRQLEAAGLRVLLLDTGSRGEPGAAAEIPRERLAEAAGVELESLARADDRGAAVAAMLRGATVVVQQLLAQGELDGIIGLGGGAGTALAGGVLQGLPYGLPKLIVSTKASGEVRPVGTKDILMLHSVTDIMGLNPILRQVLSNAAAAMAGMLSLPPVDEQELRPAVALTAFGVTTEAALACRAQLQQAGLEVMVFHANGTGGRAMEELIAAGYIRGVLDLTTTELADELCGGVQSAGPERLLAAGRHGLPQVVVPGAMDMVNFGPPQTVPPPYRDRLIYRHNPATTLLRTNIEENAELGRRMAARLLPARRPPVVLLPLRGFSAYDREGGVFFDPEADRAFIAALEQEAAGRLELRRLDLHINDPAFASATVTVLLAQMQDTNAKEEQR